MIKNIEAVETALGLQPGEFKTMYESADEKELPVADYSIEKKSDLDTRIKNLEKAKYDEGKIAGDEIVKKDFAKAFGIDISGEKSKKANVDFFKTEISTKILADAKIEPSKKIAELEADKQKALGMVGEWETKYTGLESSFKERENSYKVSEAIKSKLPASVKTKIPLSDMATLYGLKRNPKMDAEGRIVIHGEDGQVMKNEKTLSPLTIEEDMLNWQTQYLEAAAGGGRGGDNPGQAKQGTLEAFDKEMKDASINVGSQKYNEEMRNRIKAKTLII